MALRIAAALSGPVFNLARDDHRARIAAICSRELENSDRI